MSEENENKLPPQLPDPEQSFTLKRVGYRNDYRDIEIVYNMPEEASSDSFDDCVAAIKFAGYKCGTKSGIVIARPTESLEWYKFETTSLLKLTGALNVFKKESDLNYFARCIKAALKAADAQATVYAAQDAARRISAKVTDTKQSTNLKASILLAKQLTPDDLAAFCRVLNLAPLDKKERLAMIAAEIERKKKEAEFLKNGIPNLEFDIELGTGSEGGA